MTQPEGFQEDRTPDELAGEDAGAPDRAAEHQNAADDDVQGHLFTGALKDLKDKDA